MKRLIVAGGGTGGHLFPALAVARELERRRPESRILFVGTGRPIEREILQKHGFESRAVKSSGLKGKRIGQRIGALGSAVRGFIESLGIIKKFEPDLVFGVGGYVSGPVVAAARMLGRPTAIHEQNSIPGLTNRLLGRMVDLVFSGFENTGTVFSPSKTRVTGNPVRQEILDSVSGWKAPGSCVRLLVVGGSQGARAVNEAVIGAVDILKKQGQSFSLMHQAGALDESRVRERYSGLEIQVRVEGFIQDMAKAYQEADLVVCRAGALTIAELSVLGKPAIFIPLPTAANNHQVFNARVLVEAGGARMIEQKDLTPEILALEIGALSQDPGRLEQMSAAIRTLARPEATRKIVDLMESLVGSRGGR